MTTATATATATQTTEFERTECTRCCGTGRYSYCRTMNGIFGPETCFKCNGHKRSLTLRGQAAHSIFADSLSVPSTELHPGMVVRSHCNEPWAIVKEAREGREGDGSCMINTDGSRRYWFHVLTDKCSHGTTATTMWRVAHSKEQKRAKIDLAYRYQDCLTKAGKIAKKHTDEAIRIAAELSA